MSKIKGIDLSAWQDTIDFTKVAKDNIKFAVLRQGYRKTIDNKFLEYVKGCQDNNIYIMVYHFIYTDGATPEQNAQSTYNNLKKANLNPNETWIAADLEYDTWTKNGEKCTKEKCTKYTKQYLDALEALGCKKLFIYTNNDYYKNYFNWSELKYPIWLADYSGQADYNCIMHQYSSTGRVNGINGNVDLDWLFDQSMIKNQTVITTNQKEINQKTTTKAVEYATSFDKKIAKKYKTIANLNLRTGANISKPVITIIPKGEYVNCYGYHTKDWYYVKYKNYTGFCSKNWLK